MLTIQYLNASDFERANWGDNLGRVFFDLGDFEARLTKALDNFAEYQQISQEASLSGDLPATQKNRALLEKYNPDALQRSTEIIRIEAIQDGERVSVDGAIVKGFEESEKVYDFEVFAQSYLDDLEATVLADLTGLGTYEFTEANVLATWAGDRQTLALPGLCDYGAFGTPGDVKLQDLRIWFNLGLLMRAACNAVNWSFDSPHFFEGDGRHIYVFLSSKEEFFYEGKRSLRFVSAETTEEQSFSGGRFINVLDLTATYDPFSIFNSNQYEYAVPDIGRAISLRVRVENMIVELPPSPPGEPAYFFELNVRRRRAGGTYDYLVFRERFVASADQTQIRNFSIQWTDYEAQAGDKYSIDTNYRKAGRNTQFGQNYTVLSASVFYEPDASVFYEGDNIPLNNILPADVSCKSLLEAMLHICNGKLYTDIAAKKVILYTPHDYLLQDDETLIEGFYKPTDQLDFVSKTVHTKTGWKNDENERNRFLKFAFKDSSDSYLQNPEQFNRTVDLGTGKNDTTTIENPLFEATGEIQETAADVGGTGGIFIPALWDNEENEISTDLSPRVAVFYGEIDQNETWSFKGNIRTTVPYLAMIPGVELSVDPVPLTFSSYARGLYEMHYKAELQACRAAITYDLIIDGGDDTYRKINFRQPLLVKGEQSTLLIQPTAIRDHKVGSLTPLLVQGRII
ncbi:MAG: hypothetical protein R2824_06100 [Saprospiraceae bacterium]|nr:hypothetical protein [Lewinella sp.]